MSTDRRLNRAYLDVGELVEEHRGSSPADLKAFFDDPVAFAVGMGADPVGYQRDVMRSVVSNRFTVWRACHSAGKEYIAGLLAPWAACVRGMLVLVVSQTETQVVGQTMREVGAGFSAAAKTYGLGYKRFQRSVRIAGEDRVIALTGSADVDALTGWHDAEHGVFVIISEGQGERLEDSAYDAAFANANTSKGRILSMGNPVRSSGRFYEINTHSSNWRVFKTSAFDTPNVRAGRVVRPGFPGPDWPAEIEAEYRSRSHPYYVSRVLAEFPETSEDSLITRDMWDRAVELFRDETLDGEARREHYVIGCDPARLGPDSTVLCFRQGPVVRGFTSWRGLNIMDSASRVEGEVGKLLQQYKAADVGGAVERVIVDEVGLGAGLLDRLRDLLPRHSYITYYSGGRASFDERRVDAEGFSAAKVAPDSARFVNARAQAFWTLKRLMEDERLALPDLEPLREELLAIRVTFGSDSRTQIEAKDRLKARLGRSPDHADALAISLAPLLRDPKRKRLIFG